MLRHLFCRLLLVAFLLAPSGCAQSATAPDGATAPVGAAPVATPALATPASAATGTIPQPEAISRSPPPTESASTSLQTLAAPTANTAPTDWPANLPAATARPTSIAVSPQAAPGRERVILRGVITSLDGNHLRLDVSSERISLTDTTT